MLLTNTNQLTGLSPAQNNKSTKRNKKKIALKFLFSEKGLIVVLALAMLTLGGLYYTTNQSKKDLESQVAGVTDAKELNEIIGQLKKIVNIDPNEKVNVARIDNTDVLKKDNPTFYKDVKQNDYLIVMPDSRRVLIFDKENNRIVNFSSYNVMVDFIPEEQIEDSEKPLTIEIRYSSNITSDELTKFQTALNNASSNFSVTAVNQTANTYKGATVILLNRTNKPKMSQNIVATLGTSSVKDKMPENEAASDADVVILVGSTK